GPAEGHAGQDGGAGRRAIDLSLVRLRVLPSDRPRRCEPQLALWVARAIRAIPAVVSGPRACADDTRGPDRPLGKSSTHLTSPTITHYSSSGAHHAAEPLPSSIRTQHH